MQVLPPPNNPMPKDPALEHIDAIGGNLFKLFLVKIIEHT